MTHTLVATAVDAGRLAASRRHCRAVARDCSSTFYRGMSLVPEPQRSAVFAVYAWLREADNIADGDNATPADKRRRLERFWVHTRRAIEDPGLAPDDLGHWPAFADAARRHRLPELLLRQVICGQLTDVHPTRYDSFGDLYRYCYRAGSVVGLLCLRVWGYDGGRDTRRLAELRGVAFQLTNILRDVREDALRGRVYLPTQLCAEPLTPALLLGPARPCLVDTVRTIATRARGYYDASAELEPHVHPEGRRCLRAMTEAYSSLLSEIERRPQAVFDDRRVSLPKWRKAWIAMKAICC